jgi:hypothetical protein
MTASKDFGGIGMMNETQDADAMFWLSFSSNTLYINGCPIKLDYPISEAFELGDVIIVLLDSDAYAEKFGQFQNLIALNEIGELLWKAELPTAQSGDRYYKIAKQSPLIVYSIYSEECEIDPATGKIKTKTFFK